MNQAELIETLRQRKGNRSQVEYARFLGIAQSTLSMLLSGALPLGPGVARRIAKAYPDLALALAVYLLGDDKGDTAA